MGLPYLMEGDVLGMQIAVLAASALLFAASIVVAIMAFRAAGAASKSRLLAEGHHRAVQDLSVELRRLSAQVERVANKRYAAPEEASPVEAGVRIGAADGAEEAEVSVIAAPDAPPATHDLDAAKIAATVPSALIPRPFYKRK